MLHRRTQVVETWVEVIVNALNIYLEHQIDFTKIIQGHGQSSLTQLIVSKLFTARFFKTE
jgi:hypothetical protein